MSLFSIDRPHIDCVATITVLDFLGLGPLLGTFEGINNVSMIVTLIAVWFKFVSCCMHDRE